MPLKDVARTHASRIDRTALTHALVDAVATMLAAIATLLCTLALAPGAGPAILAVVLCISLSRSQLDRDLKGRLEAALVLPVVGLVALAVGWLLRHAPWAGATVFVAGMSVSIWLRRFGAPARRAGSLIALPFVALLTVPHIQPTAGAQLPSWLVPIVVAWLALLWVAVFHGLADRLSARRKVAHAAPALVPAPADGTRLPASTRMAVQMAVALAAAFVAGFLAFPERWGWVVLTAFIVNSGNQGRLDVVYKSGMRVLGAGAGTALALIIGTHAAASPGATTAWILASLFLGVWLRPFGYAWWALFVTVALALLQGFADAAPAALLWLRMEEIMIGALIGIAAAWLVLPVRSTDVLRRRLADALAVLSEAMDPTAEHRQTVAFDVALDRLEQVAAPFRAVRLLSRRRHAEAADWADALLDCRRPARALVDLGQAPAQVRRAIGAARRAQRGPDSLLPALHELRTVLRSAAQRSTVPLAADNSP
ncbi:FUSC family protein [Dyella sp. BiH032]|uniref:FUSC family protein n=1 Tax=Dyella sp. BiH032 TaxID=3075430 RepID=UPI002892E36E|nr:FUSC family protein [Dyella sp. BiH032]WNL45740.1 FUSC family protein [Dyella sp. BiH032]